MNPLKNQHPDFFNQVPLEKKTALLFELAGYEVEHNRRFGGKEVDIFFKNKKIFGSNYESWVCLFYKGNGKVWKKSIDHLFHILEAVRKELSKASSRYNDCQAMYISENGFTQGAIKTAKSKRIELVTRERFSKILENFIRDCEKTLRLSTLLNLYILCLDRMQEGKNCPGTQGKQGKEGN